MSEQFWRRHFKVTYSGTPVKVMRVEAWVAYLQNARNLTATRALAVMLDIAADTLDQDPDAGTVELEELGRLSRYFDVARAEAARKKDFETVCRELGSARSLEIAREMGLDGLDMDKIKSFLPAPSRSEIMREWIRGYLSNGGKHSSEKVIEDAISEEILSNPKSNKSEFERELNLFRKAANDVGASGGTRGMWQLAKEYIN